MGSYAASFSYDASGNRLCKQVTANLETTDFGYQYDSENRLTVETQIITVKDEIDLRQIRELN